MIRKSTGKRLRFKVFDRDGFICQYCGKRPPEVVLHIDHIVPVSKGGEGDIENLVTACADCNLGKSNIELGKLPRQVVKNIEDIEERYEQLKAFYNYQTKLRDLKEVNIEDVADYWCDLWDGESSLNNRGKSSIRRFLQIFSPDEVKDAMDASMKVKIPGGAFKYMCGVLHNRRKERERSIMESTEV